MAEDSQRKTVVARGKQLEEESQEKDQLSVLLHMLMPYPVQATIYGGNPFSNRQSAPPFTFHRSLPFRYFFEAVFAGVCLFFYLPSYPFILCLYKRSIHTRKKSSPRFIDHQQAINLTAEAPRMS